MTSDLLISGAAIIPAAPFIPRSTKWPAFLKKFLKKNPRCLGCGRKADTGHHFVPFHIDPSLELVEENIGAVCIADHFVIAHASRWELWVKTAKEDLAYHLKRVQAAEKELHERGK